MPFDKQLEAAPVYEQIVAARHCGRVICGACSATTLEETARHFGLSTDPDTYHAIARAAAERLVVELLHHDLAFLSEIMPRERAEMLARDVLATTPAEARFYSNLMPDLGWMPATDSTFDQGVIAVSAGGSFCLWIDDGD